MWMLSPHDHTSIWKVFSNIFLVKWVSFHRVSNRMLRPRQNALYSQIYCISDWLKFLGNVFADSSERGRVEKSKQQLKQVFLPCGDELESYKFSTVSVSRTGPRYRLLKCQCNGNFWLLSGVVYVLCVFTVSMMLCFVSFVVFCFLFSYHCHVTLLQMCWSGFLCSLVSLPLSIFPKVENTGWVNHFLRIPTKEQFTPNQKYLCFLLPLSAVYPSRLFCCQV